MDGDLGRAGPDDGIHRQGPRRPRRGGGFREIYLDLVVKVRPGSWFVGWDVLLAFAPNPNAQTVGEAMEGALTEQERVQFAEHLHPLADAGDGVLRTSSALLRASK